MVWRSMVAQQLADEPQGEEAEEAQESQTNHAADEIPEAETFGRWRKFLNDPKRLCGQPVVDAICDAIRFLFCGHDILLLEVLSARTSPRGRPFSVRGTGRDFWNYSPHA